jgi:hypothetical protein
LRDGYEGEVENLEKPRRKLLTQNGPAVVFVVTLEKVSIDIKSLISIPSRTG